MICALLDLRDLGNREARPLPYLGRIMFWDLTKLGHRLAGEYFNLEPNLKFPLIRPNLAHLRPGITIDHPAKIKALAQRGKRFVQKTNRSGRFAAGAIVKFACRSLPLNKRRRE